MGKYYDWVQAVANDYFTKNPDMIDNPNATAVRLCMPSSPASDGNDVQQTSEMSGQSTGSLDTGESAPTDQGHRNCPVESHVPNAEGTEGRGDNTTSPTVVNCNTETSSHLKDAHECLADDSQTHVAASAAARLTTMSENNEHKKQSVGTLDEKVVCHVS